MQILCSAELLGNLIKTLAHIASTLRKLIFDRARFDLIADGNITGISETDASVEIIMLL